MSKKSKVTTKPPIDPDISETTENYLKRIFILEKQLGAAKLSDLAKTMDRQVSSTSEAVKRMADEGYLVHERYGKITLTPKGKETAEKIHNNYTSLESLLLELGINKDIAVLDACSMEHSIHPITINTINNFVKFVEENDEARHMMETFYQYNKDNMDNE